MRLAFEYFKTLPSLLCESKFDYTDILSAASADRAWSRLNFFFHLKSWTNLIKLRKFNSRPQYNQIDLSFSINLQELNLNVCEEYKTKCDVQIFRSVAFKTRNPGALKFTSKACDENVWLIFFIWIGSESQAHEQTQRHAQRVQPLHSSPIKKGIAESL